MGFFILLGDCQPLTADVTDHLGARNEAGSIAYVYYLEGAVARGFDSSRNRLLTMILP